MEKETWKRIKGFSSYEISSYKRVRKFKKKFFFFNSYCKKVKSNKDSYVFLESKLHDKNGSYVLKKVSFLYEKTFNKK